MSLLILQKLSYDKKKMGRTKARRTRTAKAVAEDWPPWRETLREMWVARLTELAAEAIDPGEDPELESWEAEPDPVIAEDPEPPAGCWNCGSRTHLARNCDREKREYCFRCGSRGCTVRTCPHCRQGWLAQGPYIPGRGYPGPDPPRGLRARRQAPD